MSYIQFSPKDFLRSKVVKPSNYLVQINQVTEAMSKDGQSKNYTISDAEIIRDADSGSNEYSGVPTPWWSFNSKRPEFMIPFLEALGVALTPDTKIDWQAVAGKKVIVFIGNGERDGKLENQVKAVYKTAPSE